METIKKYVGLIGAAVITILSALLLRKSRQLDATESALNAEKTNGDIRVNEKEREMARDVADELLASYERLKRDDR